MTENTHGDRQQKFFALYGDIHLAEKADEAIASFYKHLSEGKGSCTTLQDMYGCLVQITFLDINAEGAGADHRLADAHAFQVWWLKAIRRFGLLTGELH
jgi:hypothetical protein